MDRTSFQRHLTLLSLSARHTGDSSPAAIDALIALWWRKFGDLPDGILGPAFELALDTCKFFPSIAEFHELIHTVARAEGGIADGATAWEAIERDIIGRWSETNDRLLASTNRRYPWPDDRSRAILRDEMGCMVSSLAQMHPKGLAEVRERFVAKYDATLATEQARAGVARLAEGGNVRQLREGVD
jgi:hypothetical protein